MQYSLNYTSTPVFLQEEQIFKSSKWERPREVYGTNLQDVSVTK